MNSRCQDGTYNNVNLLVTLSLKLPVYEGCNSPAPYLASEPATKKFAPSFSWLSHPFSGPTKNERAPLKKFFEVVFTMKLVVMKCCHHYVGLLPPTQ